MEIWWWWNIEITRSDKFNAIRICAR